MPDEALTPERLAQAIAEVKQVRESDERKARAAQKSVELRGTLQVGQGEVRPLSHMYAICPYGDTT